jgi:hypothetical protein
MGRAKITRLCYRRLCYRRCWKALHIRQFYLHGSSGLAWLNACLAAARPSASKLPPCFSSVVANSPCTHACRAARPSTDNLAPLPAIMRTSTSRCTVLSCNLRASAASSRPLPRFARLHLPRCPLISPPQAILMAVAADILGRRCRAVRPSTDNLAALLDSTHVHLVLHPPLLRAISAFTASSRALPRLARLRPPLSVDLSATGDPYGSRRRHPRPQTPNCQAIYDNLAALLDSTRTSTLRCTFLPYNFRVRSLRFLALLGSVLQP